ncbi:MAG: bifunctional homocysteine S-methyltransferase/methylenetetrahydrofolate reductase [Spirochaetaceae bacterium]|nr:bifunctional homocysteine S-methyltransferase/methylenetetrahydrofolate reductase [Spirochaetaceae bacterium]
MKKPYLERLKDGVLLFDGAMGTMIYDSGVFINQCFENVNLSSPDTILNVHRKMADAGAQVLTTNSFGANPIKLKTYDLEDKTEEINIKSVELAREVAGDKLYVAGSIGPSSVRMAPIGNTPRNEVEDAFRIQISALLKGGVDLLLFETFRNLDELILACRTARLLNKEIAIQAQISLRPEQLEINKKPYLDLFKHLDDEKSIDVVGMNCSTGPADMLDILKEIQGRLSKPFSIMPNAGYPRDIDGRQMYLASPEYFAEYSLKFLDSGVSVIGGCCGTTQEHIKKMGEAFLSLDKGRRTQIVINQDDEFSVIEIPLNERSSFGKSLAEGEWVTSIELVPPVGTNLSSVLQKSEELSNYNVSVINIPDGPRASSRISAFLTATEIYRLSGMETIPHICCRDKNLIGLQSELLSSQAAGLHNLLIITGDPPKVGNYPNVTGVFDVDSIGLISLAASLNKGIDLGGKSLSVQTSFVIGAGINPTAQFVEKEIERAFMKAEAGADFFITQPVFDLEVLSEFLDKLKGTNVPVLAGIWPLASYRNALFLNNEVPGVKIPEDIMERMEKQKSKESARDEGIIIARDSIKQIKNKIAGIQVSPPFGRIDTALEVIA